MASSDFVRAARAGGDDIRPAITLAVGRAKALFSFEKWRNPDEEAVIQQLEEELGPVAIPPIDALYGNSGQ